MRKLIIPGSRPSKFVCEASGEEFPAAPRWELISLTYKGIVFEALLPNNIMEYFDSEVIERGELALVKMCSEHLYKIIKDAWKGEWLMQQAEWAFEEDEYQ